MKQEKEMASVEADYFDLGSFHRPISTGSADAQLWLDRGLTWCYGFNHEEAVRCFDRAAAADSGCAMAHWGVAYAIGPNYNRPWDSFDRAQWDRTVVEAHAALDRARDRSAPASPVERALMEALRPRFPRVYAPPGQRSAWNRDYCRAMERVYGRFPHDGDVAALYADALMNLTPWALWSLDTGRPRPGARTLEAKTVLETALVRDRHHPGLLHLYIHLMEMSPEPEAALRLADNLRRLIPDSGHLTHMPTHLDMLVGDYRSALAGNALAMAADCRFVARQGAMNVYSLYRMHNFHFRIYAAMFVGQIGVALETVSASEEAVPDALLRVRSPPMADWLEGFLSMRVHVLVRFGRWHDLLALAVPADADLYCVTTAMIHYGRGIALAATARVAEAERERDLFLRARERVPPSRTLFNNRCVNILELASEMLHGELEYRRGEIEPAFACLREAIRLDDHLPYDEPWGWMQPTRHAYGALLLEQGRVHEAAHVYAADLGFDASLPRPLQHRNNVWALHGYHECLLALGRHAEASIVEPQLKTALAVADVPIRSSCFCRGRTAEIPATAIPCRRSRI